MPIRTFADLLARFRRDALSQHDKGAKFERLMRRCLPALPLYAGQFDQVWLWRDFPFRAQFGGKDTGIDLVARTFEGEYWAVQCKCYAETAHIDKAAVDGFLATSSRTFADDSGETTAFAARLWIATTNNWGKEAEATIRNQKPPVYRLSLADLEAAPLDWAMLADEDGATPGQVVHGDAGADGAVLTAAEASAPGPAPRLPRKTPRPHQEEAIASFREHFAAGNTRGKLIMACGAGKTFTALKIAEDTAGKNGGLVLFLAPSIALVAQTLREWMAEAALPLRPLCVCSDPKVSETRKKRDDGDGYSVVDLALPATTDARAIAERLKRFNFHFPNRPRSGPLQGPLPEGAVREADWGSNGPAHTTASAQKQDRCSLRLGSLPPSALRADTSLWEGGLKCPASRDNEGEAPHPALTVVFATYQSIDAVEEAARLAGCRFDLTICDEAHRTTGYTVPGEDPKPFVRVHDEDFPTKLRLYMTATPRIFAPDAKKKAEAADALLCSMDDETMYGPEVYVIGFGKAVELGLLTDYKVLVFTLSERQIPATLQRAVADKGTEIDTDDAAKFVGCINALSKKMLVDEGLLVAADPEPMRKAVAFCANIKTSKKIAAVFNGFDEEYAQSLPEAERESALRVAAEHVDGTMPATARDAKLAWLNQAANDGRHCRILTNVKCLSEGVDVPSLDAVLFLSPKNSPIDVVQSVGRVMRRAEGKKYGYIVIPVLIPGDVRPEDALNDNQRFNVVWTVLNALRAHDDRFEATVNAIDLNRPGATGNILIGGMAADGEAHEAAGPTQLALPLDMRELQGAIYARLVLKVGNRHYWEQWAADVAVIAQNYIERLTRLIQQEGPHQERFHAFLEDLRKNINPSVSAPEVVEMLAQHVITRPVFETLFENYSFVSGNPVSRSLQKMVDLLEEQAFEKDTVRLSRFYETVKNRAGKFKDAADRQKAILELYDKFFRTAFPRTVEKLGIVYTPVEIVDFINRSADWVLRKEFGKGLADENVHILDPFTGTGTFIARLIQSGLIPKEALARKYRKELHANEIVLLAYYIASINIENAYHDAMGEETEFVPFPGICLTDTFQLGEEEYMPTPSLPQNSERVKEQRDAPIRVIVGNPPYSVGQKSANDNAQNQKYERLESRIAGKYAAGSTATLKNSLYDSYIKAFRWATDRLEEGGIIAFVTNAGWLDGNAMDGFRKCLQREFSSIYVINLRGNCRTSGETRRKEAGNIFGLGSRAPIAINILVKIPGENGQANIYYYDIGDYLTREEKLQIIADKESISDIDWTEIHPNEHGDWLNLRNDVFAAFIPLGDKDNKKNKNTFFEPIYSRGLATSRDAWCYNYSQITVIKRMQSSIAFYNSEATRIAQMPLVDADDNALDLVDKNPQKFSWDRQQRKDVLRGIQYSFSEGNIYESVYRPFQKSWCYFSREINNCVYQMPKVFPSNNIKNIVICICAGKNNFPMISEFLPDLHLNGDSQCFPLYYYEEEKKQLSLLDNPADHYTKKDGITDFILTECRQKYGPSVTKEDIFYYVYGLLHSPDYRETFAADLKKMLPRLPLVATPTDFLAFSAAGRALADLHLRYEEQPPCPEVQVSGAEHGDFKVTKMRFLKKGDKSSIQYNDRITLTNIPLQAYEYIVNGRSAVEWIMERYQIKMDKASSIVNDPNDWAVEHEKPRYILDLLLSIVTVSLETMKIVRGLPRLEFRG